MVAIFVGAVTSGIVASICDTTTLQYTANRNTQAWDKARFLAEAGIQHAYALLEADNTWRTGITSTQFPSGSGDTYAVTATGSSGSNVVLTATGTSSGVTRTIQATVTFD
jgi:type II secretory pathway component PulK